LPIRNANLIKMMAMTSAGARKRRSTKPLRTPFRRPIQFQSSSRRRPQRIATDRLAEDPTTLADLADEFGVSRARQIDVRSFEKVQKAVRNPSKPGPCEKCQAA
jgi:DNA-directed RNA polymerase sigma subunit (sigma70/sigma32)